MNEIQRCNVAGRVPCPKDRLRQPRPPCSSSLNLYPEISSSRAQSLILCPLLFVFWFRLPSVFRSLFVLPSSWYGRLLFRQEAEQQM